VGWCAISKPQLSPHGAAMDDDGWISGAAEEVEGVMCKLGFEGRA
jgi:hypothetical protein